MSTESILLFALGCIVLIWVVVIHGMLWLMVCFVTPRIWARIHRLHPAAVGPVRVEQDSIDVAGRHARAILLHTILAIVSVSIVCNLLYLLIDTLYEMTRGFETVL